MTHFTHTHTLPRTHLHHTHAADLRLQHTYLQLLCPGSSSRWPYHFGYVTLLPFTQVTRPLRCTPLVPLRLLHTLPLPHGYAFVARSRYTVGYTVQHTGCHAPHATLHARTHTLRYTRTRTLWLPRLRLLGCYALHVGCRFTAHHVYGYVYTRLRLVTTTHTRSTHTVGFTLHRLRFTRSTVTTHTLRLRLHGYGSHTLVGLVTGLPRVPRLRLRLCIYVRTGYPYVTHRFTGSRLHRYGWVLHGYGCHTHTTFTCGYVGYTLPVTLRLPRRLVYLVTVGLRLRFTCTFTVHGLFVGGLLHGYARSDCRGCRTRTVGCYAHGSRCRHTHILHTTHTHTRLRLPRWLHLHTCRTFCYTRTHTLVTFTRFGLPRLGYTVYTRLRLLVAGLRSLRARLRTYTVIRYVGWLPFGLHTHMHTFTFTRTYMVGWLHTPHTHVAHVYLWLGWVWLHIRSRLRFLPHGLHVYHAHTVTFAGLRLVGFTFGLRLRGYVPLGLPLQLRTHCRCTRYVRLAHGLRLVTFAHVRFGCYTTRVTLRTHVYGCARLVAFVTLVYAFGFYGCVTHVGWLVTDLRYGCHTVHYRLLLHFTTVTHGYGYGSPHAVTGWLHTRHVVGLHGFTLHGCHVYGCWLLHTRLPVRWLVGLPVYRLRYVWLR